MRRGHLFSQRAARCITGIVLPVDSGYLAR